MTKKNHAVSYKQLDEENGQNALRLSSKFNNKVLLIKDQLNEASHPINKIVTRFDELYYLANKDKIE